MLNKFLINKFNKPKEKEDLLKSVCKLNLDLTDNQSEYFLTLSVEHFEEETHLKILHLASKSVKEKFMPGLFSKYFSYYNDKTAKFVSLCIENVLLSVKQIDPLSEKIIFNFFYKNENENFVNLYKILANLLQTNYKIYFINKFNNYKIKEKNEINLQLRNEISTKNKFNFYSSLLNKPVQLDLFPIESSDPLFNHLSKPITDASFLLNNKSFIESQLDRLYNYTENTNNLLFFYNLIIYFYNPRFSLVYDLIEKLENDFSLDLIYFLVIKGLDRKELKHCFDNLIYLDKPMEVRLGILKIISVIIFHYGAMDDFIREWIKLEGKSLTNKEIKEEYKFTSIKNANINLLDVYNLTLPELIQNIKLEINLSNNLSNFLKYNKEFYRKITRKERDTAHCDNAMVMANLIWKELITFNDLNHLDNVLQILIVIIYSTKRFYSARMQSSGYLNHILNSFTTKKKEFIYFLKLIIQHFKLNKYYFEKVLLILLEEYKESKENDDLIYELCKYDVYYFYYLIKELTWFNKKGFLMIKKVTEKNNKSVNV